MKADIYLDEIRQRLGALPAVFEADEVEALTIGIDEELARRLSDAGMADAARFARSFLRYWTRRPAYLESMTIDGAWRYDLEGEPVERVAATHQLVASNIILARAVGAKLKVAERPQAEAPPKPEPPAPKPAPGVSVTTKKKRADRW